MAQVKRLLKNNIEILYTNNVEEQIKALKAFDVNETLKVKLTEICMKLFNINYCINKSEGTVGIGGDGKTILYIKL